ncbi:two-component sensor histidine kinase [Actinoplanes lobatus]|uniref:histidine kinase n=1 Tax=Actinoplanes lobatus TaxID=113568 RepID=A0A7W7HG45_9ACTN|nr:HAMP domain-containing sensor histidine kinase [Actinoplanes lobatus]MBB4749892.1 signal transduction histidine kinase [Actinoplanes lobatus]GGN97576.1 two-component sensor histidine kinase [Actinoplanes lobatus]GIE44984.1 two-component sensor histidine kinase [Actinoplanes lobatus]
MRARLTLLVAATTVLVLLAFLVPLALLVRQVAADRALSRADDVVQSIVPIAGTGDIDALRLSVSAQSVPVTVFLPDGSVLGAPAAPTPAVRLAGARREALTVTTGEGQELVVPVLGAAGVTVIRTLVTDAELTRGVTRAWTTLAALGAALVLLGLLVADRLARAIIAPITELSAVSHRLARAELTARADPTGPPELREVAGALNHLAGRIQDLLATERERVADLSHRLRTPLTALRLEAESLRDPEESARVASAADEVARAVTAVIHQARRAGTTPTTATCDATEIVSARVAFWAVLAEDTGRDVHQALPSVPVPVAVAADDLAAALDALLGNVFAHTPDGTPLSVTLTPRPAGGAILTVADSGPGFPSGAAAQRGASGGDSTGLGLDIARQVATTFEISPPSAGGAVVRLEIPGP